MQEELQTVEAAAPRLNLSVQAVYAACRNGQLPHVRIGRRIRIPTSAIGEWIAAQIAQNAAHNNDADHVLNLKNRP